MAIEFRGRGGGKVRAYLKKRRKELMMSQEDVAQAIGISTNYYCDIENCERQQDMRASILIKLSGVLRISASNMLNEERKLIESKKEVV